MKPSYLNKVLLHVYTEDPLLALEQVLELLIPCPTSPYIYIYIFIYIYIYFLYVCVYLKKKIKGLEKNQQPEDPQTLITSTRMLGWV